MWHKPVVPEEDQEIPGINRPGSFYKYYRNVDDLPGKAKVFYEKAGKCETQFKTSGEWKLTNTLAENAGLSLDMLCRAVYLTERRLQVCIMAERRRRVEEDFQELYGDNKMSQGAE